MAPGGGDLERLDIESQTGSPQASASCSPSATRGSASSYKREAAMSLKKMATFSRMSMRGSRSGSQSPGSRPTTAAHPQPSDLLGDRDAL
jgi:hypothetical protein